MKNSADDELTLTRVSSSALREATGDGWDEWLERLDAAGAEGWDHKELVANIERVHPEISAGRWSQTIAMGYEQARGKREVGKTADAGYQIGVRRTVDLKLGAAWQLVTSRADIWLGDGAPKHLVKGEHYELPAGDDGPAASGDIRVVKKNDRLRMTWQPDGWDRPATVQIALIESKSGKTAISAHMDHLPDAETRELMRERWQDRLVRLAAVAESS